MYKWEWHENFRVLPCRWYGGTPWKVNTQSFITPTSWSIESNNHALSMTQKARRNNNVSCTAKGCVLDQVTWLTCVTKVWSNFVAVGSLSLQSLCQCKEQLVWVSFMSLASMLVKKSDHQLLCLPLCLCHTRSQSAPRALRPLDCCILMLTSFPKWLSHVALSCFFTPALGLLMRLWWESGVSLLQVN